jgi:histone deacetylase 6
MQQSMQFPSVGIVYNPRMGLHTTKEQHFERPERITSIYEALGKTGLLNTLYQIPSREATMNELLLAHNPEYLLKIIDILSNENPILSDPDMYANKDTLEAALLSAGSSLDLVKAVSSGRLDAGFGICRPPGHHATPDACMGFCFFNNVGIAAINEAKQGKRVMIMDFDVHYNNGTVDLIKAHPELDNILSVSIHRYDNGKFYPGNKAGKSLISKRIINIGFNGSQGDEQYLQNFRQIIIPNARTFQPDIIIVSAGFDAAEGDPLGGCTVTPDGYYQMTNLLLTLCPKVVMILEGGYNLRSISKSAVACIQALMKLPLDVSKV